MIVQATLNYVVFSGKARNNYLCSLCGSIIPKGQNNWRDEPYFSDRYKKGVRHICGKCIVQIPPQEIKKKSYR